MMMMMVNSAKGDSVCLSVCHTGHTGDPCLSGSKLQTVFLTVYDRLISVVFLTSNFIVISLRVHMLANTLTNITHNNSETVHAR